MQSPSQLGGGKCLHIHTCVIILVILLISVCTHLLTEVPGRKYYNQTNTQSPHRAEGPAAHTHAHMITHVFTQKLYINTLSHLLIQARLQSHIALSSYLQLLIVLPVFLFNKTPYTHSLSAAYLVDNPFFPPHPP